MEKATSLTSGKFYIPLIHILIGIAWILSSDAILQNLQAGGYLPVSEWIGSAKGIFYVMTTGLLLHVLIKKSDRDLLKSESQYKAIYMSNPYPIWFFNPNTFRFLSVNDSTLTAYGYSRQEFLNMTLFDMYCSDDASIVRQHFSTVKSDGYNYKKWKHVKKNGEINFVDSGSIISTYNNKPAIMVVVMDITYDNP